MHLQNVSKEELLREIVDMRQKLITLQAMADASAAEHAPGAEPNDVFALSAAVGTALAGHDSLRTILQRCAEAIVQYLRAATVGIWTLQSEGTVLEMQASAGIYLPLGVPDGSIPVGQSEVGRIVQDRCPYVTNTVPTDPRIEDKAWAERTGIVAFAGYPLLVEDRLVGVMAVFAQQPFTPVALQALAWVASVMAMGIDRVYVANALARSIAKVVRMNKRLRQQHAEFDEIAYLARHDLQEPLRKLITFSGLLQKDLGDGLPERAAKDLLFITDAATRMQTSMHNLLELSRLSSAAMHCEPVALDACIDQALAALASHHAVPAAVITRDALTPVWGDRLMLSQLYEQLLSNALKFCRAQRPLIHCTAEQQAGQLIFGIKDNGIGISAEDCEQIFLPFKRLHGRGEYAGTGIGLAICRKIIERHGGHLWVESIPGHGAHFKFTLAPAPQ